jgi:hypothetical protein
MAGHLWQEKRSGRLTRLREQIKNIDVGIAPVQRTEAPSAALEMGLRFPQDARHV